MLNSILANLEIRSYCMSKNSEAPLHYDFMFKHCGCSVPLGFCLKIPNGTNAKVKNWPVTKQEEEIMVGDTRLPRRANIPIHRLRCESR